MQLSTDEFEQRLALTHLTFFGVDFEVGEEIEAWLDAGDWFIPMSWAEGLGDACLNVGELQ